MRDHCHLIRKFKGADIFENFRNICINHEGLDAAWYFSAPGLIWDATLKITKIQLELLSDPDRLLMIESGIRLGIGTLSDRIANAINECLWGSVRFC